METEQELARQLSRSALAKYCGPEPKAYEGEEDDMTPLVPVPIWSDASYRVMKTAYTTTLQSLRLMTEERNRLKEEADEVAAEAMDAALNQDVLMVEVKRLTRQRAWLLASWGVLVVATAGNAVIGCVS